MLLEKLMTTGMMPLSQAVVPCGIQNVPAEGCALFMRVLTVEVNGYPLAIPQCLAAIDCGEDIGGTTQRCQRRGRCDVAEAEVKVSVHAADGTLVRTLELGQMPAGVYQSCSRAAYWDGRNARGESVASGVYFYTLQADDFSSDAEDGDSAVVRGFNACVTETSPWVFSAAGLTNYRAGCIVHFA